MKVQSIFSWIFILGMAACQSTETAKQEQLASDSNKVEIKKVNLEETLPDGTKSCYEFNSYANQILVNLIFDGNRVVGVMDKVAPQGKIEIYTNYNIKGTLDSTGLKVTLTIAKADDGQNIGKSSEELWLVEGNIIRNPEPEDAILNLAVEEVDCYPNAPFIYETQELDLIDNSFELVGTFNDGAEFKMFIHETTDSTDIKYNLYEGYYYLADKGEKNKIELSGKYTPSEFDPLLLEARQKGRKIGNFIIDETPDFNYPIRAYWKAQNKADTLTAEIHPK